MTPADLKAWRKARSLTQQQAGELVGYQDGPKGGSAGRSWGRVERGEQACPPMLEKLLLCLGSRPSTTTSLSEDSQQSVE